MVVIYFLKGVDIVENEDNEKNFGKFREFMSQILGKEEEQDTEEELLNLVEEAEQEGELDKEEGRLIRNAIGFNELVVSDILTPRVDIVAVSKEESQEEIAEKFYDSGFSRFPVYDGTIDSIVGVINEKDFHNYVIYRKRTVESIIKPIQFVPHSMELFKLLKLLQKSKSHMAVVTDDYSGTMGIVTLEDILEELVGEIWDEHDKVKSDLEAVSPDECKVAGGLSLDKLFDYFGMENEFPDVSTVSGMIIELMERIPNEGEYVEFKNLKFTVLKKDFRRIVKVDALRKE